MHANRLSIYRISKPSSATHAFKNVFSIIRKQKKNFNRKPDKARGHLFQNFGNQRNNKYNNEITTKTSGN